MTRRSIITLSTIAALGLALLPSSVIAQQNSLKDQLVGTWTLVSVTNRAVIQLVGTNPKGVLMIDAGGRYATVYGKPDRPKSANRAENFVANYGTWSSNESDKTITFHREGALSPNLEGMDLITSVAIAGDEMRTAAGDVWRRAK